MSAYHFWPPASIEASKLLIDAQNFEDAVSTIRRLKEGDGGQIFRLGDRVMEEYPLDEVNRWHSDSLSIFRHIY